MLKNIRLHIEQNEQQQVEIENRLAQHIAQNHKQNVEAFKRNIPSLLPHVIQPVSQNISVFANKWNDINIVDYGSGRTFYGFHPEQEVQKQVSQFLKHPLAVELENNSSLNIDENAMEKYLKRHPLPSEVDVLVMLGLGLGAQIISLLASSKIHHLIIYEPQLQYFTCSVLATSWQSIFALAKKQGTAIYLQLGKDGRNLLNDIAELRQHVDINQFFCFQHYHHPIFDVIMQDLDQMSWQHLSVNGFSYSQQSSSDDFQPTWAPPIDIGNLSPADCSSIRFNKNIGAFKKYFPDIHEQFKNYSPKSWMPMCNPNGSMNIVHRKNLTAWHSDDTKHECQSNFEGFSQYPHKDGLVLGYRGEKLKHYTHYQFVEKTQKIMDSVEEEQGALPETIKSIIMFGLGTGYQLEYLLENHTVEKIFICEPNRDFFYASLLSIDWERVLTTFDKNHGRIYLNIGDDGSNLFRDLLNQFYAIGPYVLSNTYFYQSYYNSALNHSISQLREQLRVVISMGEYFDHARFGIAHTKYGLNNGYRHMRRHPDKLLGYEDKEVPIFFVGNGPSLDFSIDALKELKENAIIVSCGTALQVLRKNQIVPDFHAEIEQNRSTFDWATRIDDFDFLKCVTLISCNGIHPDTCQLYKDVYIAFKDGESSTTSTLEVLGYENYEQLQYAFPTVTNFAVNFFSKLGFTQMYLLGVDLGFVDAQQHHSIQSGYYNDSGQALYDYSEKNNTSLVVPGNFRPTVNTKDEFKIAKILLEQSLASSSTECYNTSDGARIQGTVPLHVEQILVIGDNEQKYRAMQNMKMQCFTAVDYRMFKQKYELRYSSQSLHDELTNLMRHLQQDVKKLTNAEKLVESQKMILFASYKNGKSLLFYYLYGTFNYANAFLIKLLNAASTDSQKLALFNQGLTLWIDCLKTIQDELTFDPDAFDSSSAIGDRRITSYLKHNLTNKNVLVVTDSTAFAEAFRTQFAWYGAQAKCQIEDAQFINTKRLEEIKDTTLIVRLKHKVDYESLKRFSSECADQGLTMLILSDQRVDRWYSDFQQHNELLLQALDGAIGSEEKPLECNEVFNSQLAIQVYRLAQDSDYSVIIPKYSIVNEEQLLHTYRDDKWQDFHVYDLGNCVALSERRDLDSIVIPNGTRTRYKHQGLIDEDLIRQNISEHQYVELKDNLKHYQYLWADETYVSK